MKKLAVIVLALAMLLTFASCSFTTLDPNAKSEGVLTYAQFDAADLETEVTIEGFIVAKQYYSKDYGNTSLYLQDLDGGYFVYRISCSEEDYEGMKVGYKVKITGTKTEWSGEVEIINVTSWTVTNESYTFKPIDVTGLLEKEDLIKNVNRYVVFKGMKVVAKDDGVSAFYYKWNNTGAEGDDLYFDVEYNGKVYSFTVETDLCNADTDVYKAVKELKVGDVIDIEGFLYWYNGANPHTTKITKK